MVREEKAAFEAFKRVKEMKMSGERRGGVELPGGEGKGRAEEGKRARGACEHHSTRRHPARYSRICTNIMGAD